MFTYLFLQTLISVTVMNTAVMSTQTALIQREVSPAPATLATLETESTVQVSGNTSHAGSDSLSTHLAFLVGLFMFICTTCRYQRV